MVCRDGHPNPRSPNRRLRAALLHAMARRKHAEEKQITIPSLTAAERKMIFD